MKPLMFQTRANCDETDAHFISHLRKRNLQDSILTAGWSGWQRQKGMWQLELPMWWHPITQQDKHTAMLTCCSDRWLRDKETSRFSLWRSKFWMPMNWQSTTGETDLLDGPQ